MNAFLEQLGREKFHHMVPDYETVTLLRGGEVRSGDTVIISYDVPSLIRPALFDRPTCARVLAVNSLGNLSLDILTPGVRGPHGDLWLMGQRPGWMPPSGHIWRVDLRAPVE